jgi:hypothetical protein
MLHNTIVAVAISIFIALLLIQQVETSSHVVISGVDDPTVDHRNFWLGKLILYNSNC